MPGCTKRYRPLLVPMNDEERLLLDDLVTIHTVGGHKPSKAFIARYALKCLLYATSASA